MDSGLIVFRREPVEIRVVKDRSEWSVDLVDRCASMPELWTLVDLVERLGR